MKLVEGELNMVRQITSRVWHITRWTNTQPDSEGGCWFQLALCNKRQVRHGAYLDGSHPDHAKEIDLSKDVCSMCRKRYEAHLVRELRKDLSTNRKES